MTEPLNNDQVFISKLNEIILANLKNENFSVRELAHDLRMSNYRLNRRLYLIKGKKVNQYIRDVRLQKALELLRAEERTASEVAYLVGFSSPAYFNKCFHEYFGYPPGKIIRKEFINPNGSSAEMRTEDSAVTGRRRKLTVSPGVIVLSIVLVLIGFLGYRKIRKTVTVENEKRITITVMPFQNRTNDTIWNVWQEGIQECLISSLSKSNELKIRQNEALSSQSQNTGIARFANISPILAGNVLKKLNTSLYINGSIKKADSIIRLDAQLIDARTQEILKAFEINGQDDQYKVIHLTDSLRKEITDFLLISELITENPWLMHSRRSSTESPLALRYYIYGYIAYNKADWATAENWFMKSLDADSNYIDAMSRLYYSLKNQDKMELALTWLIKLYKNADQMSILNRLYIKFSYAEIFEPTEVRIKYLRQLQEIDNQGNYHYLIAAMYVRAKQFDKAIPEHEKYLEISRKRGKEYLKDNWGYPALGEMYHITGRFKKEKKLYREAEEVNNDHTSVYFSWIIRDQGTLALTEGDTIAANQYIEKFKSVAKGNSFTEADIDDSLGAMYWQAGKMDKAEEYFRKALSREPDNPVRMAALANCIIDSNKNLNEVSDLMDRASALASSKYDYYNYLDIKGWGLFKQGKIQMALDILQKTWDSTPFKLYRIKAHLDEVKNANSAGI
jgi:AraC-like DNA-binding protein/TolB-like protein/Tfp pilus assembly protein PilF